MEIVIRIKTDNAAFDMENGGPEAEVARILKDYARQITDGLTNAGIGHGRKLRDVNGNTVGSVEVRD